jgi:hypothetical protein
MGDALWRQLPVGLLKKTPRGWLRLDPELRLLIVKLARAQNFKCAFCERSRNLIVEHDHFPEHGRGDIPTIYNVRGLACSRCNWHIGMYEADLRGNYHGWDNAYIYISESNFWPYAYSYECRSQILLEERLEQQLGSAKYWRRRLFLQKFDAWRDWGDMGRSKSHYAQIKERKQRRIRTAKQFSEVLRACLRFIVEEKQRTPGFEPPDQFVKLLLRVRPFLDDLCTQNNSSTQQS